MGRLPEWRATVCQRLSLCNGDREPVRGVIMGTQTKKTVDQSIKTEVKKQADASTKQLTEYLRKLVSGEIKLEVGKIVKKQADTQNKNLEERLKKIVAGEAKAIQTKTLNHDTAIRGLMTQVGSLEKRVAILEQELANSSKLVQTQNKQIDDLQKRLAAVEKR